MANIQSVQIGREVTGYFQETDLTTAIPCPGVGSVVIIQAEEQPIRYRTDGVDPTISSGMILAVGESREIWMGEGKIQNIRAIQTAAGAVLNVESRR